MRIIIALGGNALQKNPGKTTNQEQEMAAFDTAKQISKLFKKSSDIKLIITHGNGPQVGEDLLRVEIAQKQGIPSMPLYTCVANTQGRIGFMLQNALNNVFKKEGIDRKAATVVTEVLVSKDDEDFKNPSKPIGMFYTKEEAEEKKKLGWILKEDANRGFRRVVPSPQPLDIVQLEQIKDLFEDNIVTIAVGGGGIPVIEENDQVKGVDAVIDKDRATSLLARKLKVDLMIIATAVDKVYLNFGKENEKALDKISVEEAKKYMKEGHFAPGSMLPKVEACVKAASEGIVTCITSLEKIDEAIESYLKKDYKVGTWIMEG